MNIRIKALCALTLSSTMSSVLAHAQPELDVHGAVATGYIKSTGNNYLSGNTLGTSNVFEVAINARTSLSPEILVAG